MTLPDYINQTYNALLEAGWRMKDIDDMDMPGYLRILAWKAKKEHEKKKPKKRCIDEAWKALCP